MLGHAYLFLKNQLELSIMAPPAGILHGTLIDQFIACGKLHDKAHELASQIWIAVLDNLEENQQTFTLLKRLALEGVFLRYPYSRSKEVEWRVFDKLFTDFRDCFNQEDYYDKLTCAKYKFQPIPSIWCFEAEQKLEESERHPINQRDKHELHPVVINDVPEDTKDEDEILESEFFDTRQAFLSLCQGNHYQYDTLRRAKHSSMMVLYHLHNPTAPAFVTTCNRCHLDIEAGQGWRCETCPDFDVCNSCFRKDGGIDHPHKLTNHPSLADCNAQNKEARQLRVVQLRKMLDLLVHASQCRSPSCQYPNCRKVKGLFRHGIHCKTRASGGCLLCKKMWYLLQLHARACKESRCHVPRCRDLNEHMRRLQQQAESRRRAAVTEMMRQRAAEVSGNNG